MSTPINRRTAFSALAAAAAALAAPAVASTIQEPIADEGVITAEQLAALEFSPWIHTEGEWKPPSNEEWARHSKAWLPQMRLAWLTMYKTKEELEIIAKDMSDESFEELVDRIGNMRDFFHGLVDLLSAAEGRLMCGATSALKKYDPEGFAEARR